MSYYDRFTDEPYQRAPEQPTMIGRFRFLVNTSEGNATLWCNDTHTGKTGRVVFRFITAKMLNYTMVLGMNGDAVVVDIAVNATSVSSAHVRRYEVSMRDFTPVGQAPHQHANVQDYEEHIDKLTKLLGSRHDREVAMAKQLRAMRVDTAKASAKIDTALQSGQVNARVVHF